MEYQTLGRSGLRVSDLILGAMTFGELGGVGAPIEECRAMLDAYLEAGGNVVDTAINYRGGASEEILGELLQGRRDSIVLGSKYTVSRDRADPNAAGNHRKNLRASLETSLRRLRTDHLDLYWVHMWDAATPLEETLRALDDAVSTGKVLYVGISDAPAWVVSRADTLAQWRGWSPFVAVQVPYSLVQRDAERELLPMADALGLGVTAWSPLGGGVLSGKYSAKPDRGALANAGNGGAVDNAGGAVDNAGGASENGGNGGAAGENGGEVVANTRLDPASISARDHAVAAAVGQVAEEIGATSAQVALAWVRRWSTAVRPIVGARTVVQLRDNLQRVELSDEQAARLEAATEFTLGFPGDFIAQTSPWVFGAAAV